MLLAAFGATIALGGLAGAASANTLSASSQSLTATWSGMVFEAPSVGVRVTCPVTLEGSLHSRTIAKVSGSLIGYINRATVGEASCSGGSASASGTPWHVQYSSFSGTLPNITSVNTNVVNAEFTIIATVLGFRVTCRYRTSTTTPATGRFNLSSGRLTNVAVGGEIASSSGGSCPRGRLSGTSSSVTPLTVTLI